MPLLYDEDMEDGDMLTRNWELGWSITALEDSVAQFSKLAMSYSFRMVSRIFVAAYLQDLQACLCPIVPLPMVQQHPCVKESGFEALQQL